MAYPVGKRVRSRTEGVVPRGTVGTVTQVATMLGGYWVRFDGHPNDVLVPESDLEPVYAVGDVVEITEDHGQVRRGARGSVIELVQADGTCRVCLENSQVVILVPERLLRWR